MIKDAATFAALKNNIKYWNRITVQIEREIFFNMALDISKCPRWPNPKSNFSDKLVVKWFFRCHRRFILYFRTANNIIYYHNIYNIQGAIYIWCPQSNNWWMRSKNRLKMQMDADVKEGVGDLATCMRM